MLICDIWAKKYAHYEFNKNILKILSSFERNINYIGDKEQIELFEFKDNVKFHKININESSKIKRIGSYVLNFLKIRKYKEKIIIILNGIPLVIFLSKFIARNKKKYIFLHGLDRLIENPTKREKYFIKMLKDTTENINYIVLGKNIQKNLIKLIPEIKDKVFSIDHPYSFSKNNINKKFDDKIIISTCGITAYEKGLNNIYKFIDKIENNFEFKHIGKSINEIQDKYVKYFPYKNEVISQKKYKNLIDKLDYILILYPNDSYKLTASGIYFDCIKFNKPLLGLKNEYFEYMFEKYGEIGKLFNTIEEIIDYLKKDKKILEKEQNIFWKNMEKIRKTLNKNVEKDLLRIIYQEETK